MKKNFIYAIILCAMALGMTACGDTVTDESRVEIISETVNSEESTETKAEKQISATELTESETSAPDTQKQESETSAAETQAETQKADEPNDNAPANNDNNNNNNNSSENNNNNPQPDDNKNEEPPASSGEFTSDDLIFRYNGNEIHLDENINDVTAKLGEPNDIIIAPSCYYDGDDKTFVYDGFSIITYPDGENDYVVSITITESGIKTEKGAEVGMTISDALAIYGDSYTNSGSNYQYQIDDKYMYFYVEDDIVQEIGIVYAN